MLRQVAAHAAKQTPRFRVSVGRNQNYWQVSASVAALGLGICAFGNLDTCKTQSSETKEKLLNCMTQLRSAGPTWPTLSGIDPQLVTASLSGDVKRVKKLIQSGAQPNTMLLHLVIRGNNIGTSRIVEVLVKEGRLDPNEAHRHVVGADVTSDINLEWPFTLHRSPPLRSFGAPIFDAVEAGNIRTVEVLLKHGADPNARDSNDRTPMFSAAEMGNVEMIKLLSLHGANPNDIDRNRTSPLQEAIRHEQYSTVSYLLSQLQVDTQYALNFALTSGMTEFLLDNGVDAHDDVAMRALERKINAVQEARKIQDVASVFLHIHGWRPLLDFLYGQLIAVPISYRRRTVLTKEMQASIERAEKKRNELEKLESNLYAIELSLSQTDCTAEQQALIARKEELLKRVLILSQGLGMVKWNDLHNRSSWSRSWRRNRIEEPAIFLSHTGQDERPATFVEFLHEALTKDHRLEAFLDTKSLETGATWQEEIEYCATHCRVFVCVLSEKYFSRYWPMHELDIAMRAGIDIIPIWHGCKPPKVTDNVLQNLAKLLEEHEITDSETLDRWCDNLRKLGKIQGVFDESTSKHSQVQFRDKAAADIVKKLNEVRARSADTK